MPEVARISDKPVAAAATCTKPPTNVPNDDSRPSRRPPASERASTYSIPGPGAMASRVAAPKKIQRWCESGMYASYADHERCANQFERWFSMNRCRAHLQCEKWDWRGLSRRSDIARARERLNWPGRDR